MKLPPLLFNKYDIFGIMDNQKKALNKAVAGAPEPASGTPDDDIVINWSLNLLLQFLNYTQKE